MMPFKTPAPCGVAGRAKHADVVVVRIAADLRLQLHDVDRFLEAGLRHAGAQQRQPFQSFTLAALQHSQDQLFLGAKVLVQRHLGHTRLGQDAVNTRSVIALPSEQDLSSTE